MSAMHELINMKTVECMYASAIRRLKYITHPIVYIHTLRQGETFACSCGRILLLYHEGLWVIELKKLSHTPSPSTH